MKVIMYPAVTLDGFIANLNGECYSWINEEDEAYYDKAIEHAGCSLVGRKTYEQYIKDFPAKNGSTTFVYTSAGNMQDHNRIKFVRGTPQEVVRQIEEYGFSELILSGGGDINGSFAEAGLVNEIIISTYGITLGEGIPLFGSYKPRLRLELKTSQEEVKGIIKSHYRVL